MNKVTVKTVKNITELTVHPADVVIGITEGVDGDPMGAAVSALSVLDTFVTAAGKSIPYLGTGVLSASVSLNVTDAITELRTDGKLKNSTVLDLLSDTAAAVAEVSALAAGGTALVATAPISLTVLAVTATVASASLAVAAMAQSPDNTAISDACTDLIDTVQSMIENTGDVVSAFFDNLGDSIEDGIENLGDMIESYGEEFSEMFDDILETVAAKADGLGDENDSFLDRALAGLGDAISDYLNSRDSLGSDPTNPDATPDGNQDTSSESFSSPLVLDLNDNQRTSTSLLMSDTYFDLVPCNI